MMSRGNFLLHALLILTIDELIARDLLLERIDNLLKRSAF